MTSVPHSRTGPTPFHFAALLLGNVALALGPWLVRLADSGPVSAGFWRLFLALPLLFRLARRESRGAGVVSRRDLAMLAGAGVFFAFDLASWHFGIVRTMLGNATLFGNSGSVILMVWGLVALRRCPRTTELLGVAMALGGTALLLGRSLEVDTRTLVGDVACILAGLFYVVYILLLQDARSRMGSWSVLLRSSIAGVPLILVMALLLGEPVWPQHWAPLVALSLSSQIVGQGLLVYALKHFTPLVIGLVLLTQPTVSVVVGWFAFGETLAPQDGMGMAMVAAALVLARLGEPAKA